MTDFIQLIRRRMWRRLWTGYDESSESSMSRPNSVEDKALAALDRLVKRRPTNELLKAKMAAGHRIITPTSVAAEAGVNRGSFGSRHARLGHVWLKIQELAEEEKRGSVTEELTKLKAENARLKALLYKTNIHNASLQLAVSRLQKRSANRDEAANVVNFRRNDRRRPR
ncbi:hypothetical protein [Stenotrophomonas maltophilia]|jgi:hypothetical protein|uniref:hypothetical protein n=2 Tax=Lysobacteraceae TaxID=32033 RepID=UPI0010720E12|nr:hypothetical protein [Stenotrophomonas maltophilia]MBH1771127.1 hypothetical protein [Stenotrophomonas maltophilia]